MNKKGWKCCMNEWIAVGFVAAFVAEYVAAFVAEFFAEYVAAFALLACL